MTHHAASGKRTHMTHHAARGLKNRICIYDTSHMIDKASSVGKSLRSDLRGVSRVRFRGPVTFSPA